MEDENKLTWSNIVYKFLFQQPNYYPIREVVVVMHIGIK